jgi:hypothetical protein
VKAELSPLKLTHWSEAETEAIKKLYADSPGRIDLAGFARKRGRSKPNVCRKARQLGLTKRSRLRGRKDRRKYKTRAELIAGISESRREWLKNNPHPRGMLGKKHTKETIESVSESSKARWKALSAKQKMERRMKAAKTRVANGIPFNPHGAWKAGWRTVGTETIYFRSRWESNYARYLEWLRSFGNINKWEHEPTTFWFEGVKRGCVSYLPDFRITNPNGSIEYHEVKGWMDARSKTKIKRMAKYHPTVKLLVIDSKSYRRLAKQISGTIDGWERGKDC